MFIILDGNIYLENAVEGSTYIVAFQLKDETETNIIPNTAEWSLRDSNGTIVNGRSAVSIITPATTNNIILSGTDLSCISDINRVITVKGAYTSTYGIDLPFAEEYYFKIKNLVGVV
jgi:hypothetical protein